MEIVGFRQCQCLCVKLSQADHHLAVDSYLTDRHKSSISRLV